MEVETDGDGANSDLAERVDAEIAAHEDKIADYEREISDRESQISDFRDKIRATQLVITRLKRIRRQVGNILAPAQNPAAPRAASKRPAKRRAGGRRYRPGSDAYIVLTVARDAIREAGRPLDRNQIIAAIEASGHRLKSMNPEQYVNKVMWGSEEFRNVGDGYDFSGSGNSKE
jgi:hypothetical protein